MYKKIFVIIPFLLNAQNFNDIASHIQNSLKYKLAQKRVEILKERLKALKAKNYGSLDFNYNALHFFNQPVMKLTSKTPIAVASDGVHLVYKTFKSELPMSDKNHFTMSVVYSYPIFSGFAITNSIKKAEIELIKEKLNVKNTKRVLLLNAAQLYSLIYTLKSQLKALKAAKKALISAKEKASALYKEGLINKSNLDEIDAKYYEIVAGIANIDSQKKVALNSLSYLINEKITDIDDIYILKKLKFNPNFQKRPDIKAIKESLKISSLDIKLAKSKLYPQIVFQAGIKKEGDNLILTKNDYQNIDKSYSAIAINYNLFDGGEKKAQIESAKLAKISALIFYNDYLKDVKTKYYNDLQRYNALFFRLKSAKKALRARESYYEYIKAKFEEGLADSTDLNDAIAKLAEARANVDAIKAEIFFLSVELNLNGGNYEF
jgi:outer membrane protein TolC